MSTQIPSRITGQVGATLTLMGVVAISVLATLVMPSLSTESNKTATAQIPPAPVRIVDAPNTKTVDERGTVLDSVTANKDCAEQTWPYIESRCLTRATPPAPLDSTRSIPINSVKSTQGLPAAPQTEITEITEIAPARSSTWSNFQPPLKDVPNNSVGPTIVKAHVPDTSSSNADISAPPGPLASRLPGQMQAPAPQATDAATRATLAGTAAAGLAITRLTAAEQPKVRTRSDRRRRSVHSSRRYQLFGFRVGGLRF